ESKAEQLPAELFNELTLDDGARQLSLDVGRSDIQHNEVQIISTGESFRRQVVLEGSDDRESWRQVATGFLLRYQRDNQDWQDSAVDYPPSRFRYLRITIYPDPILDEDRN